MESKKTTTWVCRCPDCNAERTTPVEIVAAGVPVTLRERCKLCDGVGYLYDGEPWTPGWRMKTAAGIAVAACVALILMLW